MERSFRDNSAAFLADQHRLMAFIYGMLRDYQTAEDIFQETWLQFVDAAEKGVAIRDVPQWSRGVARNLILKHWRAQRSGRDSLVVFDSQLLELATTAFAEQDARREYWETRRRALRDCLTQLPAKSRALLALKYEQRLSAAAVGERLSQTAAAVLMALSRLRRALARCAANRMEALGA